MATIAQPAAIIFDFDGVILLSEHDHLAAWRETAACTGCVLPPTFLERGLGGSDRLMAAELSAANGGRWDSAKLLELKSSHYQTRLAREMTLVAGALDALAYFHRLVPLGLATSSVPEDIAPVMERYRLMRYFSAISTLDDVKRPKPDPEIYLKTAAALGQEPQHIFVFEDSLQGIGAALAAGMQVIALTTAYPREKLPTVAGYVADFQKLDAIAALMGF